MRLYAVALGELAAGAALTVAAVQVADPSSAGPVIGYGAAATAAGVGGTWFVRYLLARFDKLETLVAETREDVAAIMGGLGIERARR